MKKSKVLLAAALMGMSTAAMAQATYTDSEENVYTFQKHWFLDLQGGAQYIRTWLSIQPSIRYAPPG